MIENAIASLLALHVASQETAIEATVIRNAPKEKRAGKSGAHSPPKFEGGKAQVVKAKTGEAIFGMSLPETRPLVNGKPTAQSAADFIVESRRAKDRDSAIKAIAAFVGYSTVESFGMQDTAARALATSLLNKRPNNTPTRQENRQAIAMALDTGKATITQYGTCDHDEKRLVNLRANEVALVDSICDYDKIANDTSKTINERANAQGMAELERARLDHVRQSLDTIAQGGTYIRVVEG